MSGCNNTKPMVQSVSSSVPIPPPPPPPPKPTVANFSTHSFRGDRRQDQILTVDPDTFEDETVIVEDNRVHTTKETHHHTNHHLRRSDRSPLDSPAFMSTQFRESDKSFASKSFIPAQQQEHHHGQQHLQRGNPTPQERRSIKNTGHQQQQLYQPQYLEDNERGINMRSREQMTSTHDSQQHFFGPSMLRSTARGGHSSNQVQRYQYQEEDEYHDDMDEDGRDESVVVKNEATQTRTVPRRSFFDHSMTRRPGNLLLSIQYFLLHVSISICLLRVSG